MGGSPDELADAMAFVAPTARLRPAGGELVGGLSARAFADGQLKVSGWHQQLKENVDGLELRLDGTTVGWIPYGGDDCRVRTMSTAPGGEAVHFDFDVTCQFSYARIATIEVVPAANFLPWGRVVGSVDPPPPTTA